MSGLVDELAYQRTQTTGAVCRWNVCSTCSESGSASTTTAWHPYTTRPFQPQSSAPAPSQLSSKKKGPKTDVSGRVRRAGSARVASCAARTAVQRVQRAGERPRRRRRRRHRVGRGVGDARANVGLDLDDAASVRARGATSGSSVQRRSERARSRPAPVPIGASKGAGLRRLGRSAEAPMMMSRGRGKCRRAALRRGVRSRALRHQSTERATAERTSSTATERR